MVEQFQQHRIRRLVWPPIALLVTEQGLTGANRAITSCRAKFLRGCLRGCLSGFLLKCPVNFLRSCLASSCLASRS